MLCFVNRGHRPFLGDLPPLISPTQCAVLIHWKCWSLCFPVFSALLTPPSFLFSGTFTFSWEDYSVPYWLRSSPLSSWGDSTCRSLWHRISWYGAIKLTLIRREKNNRKSNSGEFAPITCGLLRLLLCFLGRILWNHLTRCMYTHVNHFTPQYQKKESQILVLTGNYELVILRGRHL